MKNDYDSCTLFCNSPTIRGSTSTAITFFACSNNFIVKFPVPGPISNTISDGFIFAFSTMLLTIRGFFNKF